MKKIAEWMPYICMGIAIASFSFVIVSLIKGDMTAAGVWMIAALLAVTFQ